MSMKLIQEEKTIRILEKDFKKGDLVYVAENIEPIRPVTLIGKITGVYHIGYIDRLCFEWDELEERIRLNLYINSFFNKKCISMINGFAIIGIDKISKRKANSYKI